MTRIEVNPEINRHELASLFGGGGSRRFSRSTEMKIDRLEAKFTELIKPSLYYRQEKIASTDKGSVYLQNGSAFKSPKLSKSVNNCVDLICFIATIGEGVEAEIKRLESQNRLSVAYILDAMGSVAVESVVDKFQKRMRARYRAEGREVSLRFSPGYCDWPLPEQKKLFHFFDSFQLDVKLTDSCLMQPRKSVSGVFGIIPADMPSPARSYNPCLDCSKKTCIARRR